MHSIILPLIECALNMARTISENSTSLELLFAWLATSLSEDLDDVPTMYHRTSTLLELAGATTYFSPAAIYKSAHKKPTGTSPCTSNDVP